MKQKISILWFVVLILATVSGVSWSSQPEASTTKAPVIADEFQLSSGTLISALIQEEISTESAVVGQPVSAVVSQDIFIGARKIISDSDRIFGKVTRIEPPLRGRNAILKIEFERIIMANGIELPFLAYVKTENRDYSWGGEPTPGTKPEIIPYNVYQIGTYGRVMYHGARAMGEHIKLQPGTRMILVLEEPVSLYALY